VSKSKCFFFQVRISHVLLFISICDQFTDSPPYICIYIRTYMYKFCNHDYNCCYMNVSYVIGHERASILLFRCAMYVYSMNINILMWICEA
jgi:hypothetical protein